MEREAKQKSGAEALLEERERNFRVMFSGANNGQRRHQPSKVASAERNRPVWVRVPGALPIEHRPHDLPPHPIKERPDVADADSAGPVAWVQPPSVPRRQWGGVGGGHEAAVDDAEMAGAAACVQPPNGPRRQWCCGQTIELLTCDGERLLLRPVGGAITEQENASEPSPAGSDLDSWPAETEPAPACADDGACEHAAGSSEAAAYAATPVPESGAAEPILPEDDGSAAADGTNPEPVLPVTNSDAQTNPESVEEDPDRSC